jgi:hypothetical protein
LKWEIEKFEVDKTNFGEMMQEYKLYWPSKEDHETTGCKNRNERKVKSLRSSLERYQTNHFAQVFDVKATLRKLEKKIFTKKKDNSKVEEEILQLQLGLRERRRIFNIHEEANNAAKQTRAQNIILS